MTKQLEREESEMATWADPIPDDKKCPLCDGKGRKGKQTYWLCNGTGLKYG